MSRVGPLRAILFDVDHTLVDFETAMRRALADVRDRLRERVGTLPAWFTVDAMIAIREEAWLQLEGSGLSLEAVRLAGFRRALQRLGHDDDGLARKITDAYLERRFAWTVPYPDAVPALRALRERHTLGVVSNGNSYPERCGLAGLFHFCVFSQDHAVEKPDPRLFEIALRRAGCRANEAIHVGDSLEADVRGAQAAGITAVWLNRAGRPNETDIRPDAEVRSLAELPALCAAPPWRADG